MTIDFQIIADAVASHRTADVITRTLPTPGQLAAWRADDRAQVVADQLAEAERTAIGCRQAILCAEQLLGILEGYARAIGVDVNHPDERHELAQVHAPIRNALSQIRRRRTLAEEYLRAREAK